MVKQSKSKKIKDVIFEYHLCPFFFTALLLILLYPLFCRFLTAKGNGSVESIVCDMIRFFVPILLWTAWISAFIANLFSASYRKKTGRSFITDHFTYQLSYHQLLRYFQFSDPYKLDTSVYKENDWRKSEGVILGKTQDGHIIHVPCGKDGQNFLLLGIPASGKTSGPIILSALRFSGSVFCIDSKGDIEKVTKEHRRIKCFDLINPSVSCHFNPFEGVEKLSIDERCNFIEKIGCTIIPQNTGNQTTYFRDGANDFWNGICLYMLSKDIYTSFPQVIDAILTGSPFEWIRTVKSSDCIESQRRLNAHFGENEKNLSGCWAYVCTACRKFSSNTLYHLLGNDLGYEYISPQTLEDGFDCYIKVDSIDLQTNYGAVLSLIVQTFLNNLLKRERNPYSGKTQDRTLRPVLFLLDEFASLSTLSYDTISAAMMLGRSRNISIFLAMQSLESLYVMYGTSQAKTLIDCIGTFLFLSIQDASTRQWASQLIGQHKTLKASNSKNIRKNDSSSGKSTQESLEPILQPADFGNLIDREHGKDQLLIYSHGKYVLADKLYWYKD